MYLQRLLAWWAVALAGGLLLRTQVARQRAGRGRLALALLLGLANWAVPLLFDPRTEQATLIASFIITAALSTMKALGLALNRGPLARPDLTPAQFLAVYALPIIPREGEGVASAAGRAASAAQGQPQRQQKPGHLDDRPPSPAKLLAGYVLKMVAATAIGILLLNLGGHIPRLAQSYLYSFGLYCCLAAPMDLFGALVGALIGLPIAPHFDQPFLSTTIASFWSKRWNVTVSNALRFLVFDPVSEGRLMRPQAKSPRAIPAPKAQRRAAGVLASFFASGLLHEALLWYCSGRFWGHHLVYFSMWGPIVLAEGAWRRMLRRSGIRTPPLLAWAAVTVILHVAGDYLFWEPHRRIGSPARSLALLERAAPWLKLKHSWD